VDLEVLKAIGRIAVGAALFEERLHIVYWRYAGLSPDVGPLITGDQKPKRLFADVIKIAAVTEKNPYIRADLKSIQGEYDETAERRNQIIHWVWQSFPELVTGPEHRVFAPDHKLAKRGEGPERRANPAAFGSAGPGARDDRVVPAMIRPVVTIPAR
jgi:hypothetical protein